jgi:hypothetical protein
MNSPLKSHRINGADYRNGILSVVSDCNELVRYDGNNWQSLKCKDSTIEITKSRHFQKDHLPTSWPMKKEESGLPLITVCSVTIRGIG